jgi:hypothetical protein
VRVWGDSLEGRGGVLVRVEDLCVMFLSLAMPHGLSQQPQRQRPPHLLPMTMQETNHLIYIA